MSTLVLGSPPPEIEALKERRRRSGLDRFDEVWDGVLHIVPAPSLAHAYVSGQLAELLAPPAREADLVLAVGGFNLGEDENDYRVPDGGLHRERTFGVWQPTAALVFEIVSPDDETWDKLPFYSAHSVDEVLIVDPTERAVHWLALEGGEYREVDRSGLIDLGPSQLAERIDWPPSK
jgi:Uma2 family endonuclease